MKNSALILAFALAAISQAASVPSIAVRQDDISVDWSALNGAALEDYTPVDIPLANVNNTVTYDFDAAAEEAIAAAYEQTTEVTGIDSTDSSLRRRQSGNANCLPLLPNPAAPLTGPLNIDSLSKFQSSKALTGSAQSSFNTASLTASGVKYTRVFKNLDAAYAGTSYLGSFSIPRYNTAYCGQICSKKEGCQAFNTYFEYDPKYTLSEECPTSDPVVNVNCVLWGEPISAAGATNTGSTTQQFTTAIKGSSAWIMSARNPKSLDGYEAPKVVKGNLDNRVATGDPEFAPNWAGQNVILSTGALPLGKPYDEALCKAVADQHPTAESFATFQLIADEVYQGQGCLVYSRSDFNTEDFNDVGQYREYSAAAKAYGKTGNAYWKSNPVVFYAKSAPEAQPAPVPEQQGVY